MFNMYYCLNVLGRKQKGKRGKVLDILMWKSIDIYYMTQ